MDDLNMTRWLIFFSIFCQNQLLASGTIDINDGQLQMVADSLKMEECRKLSESLHKDNFELDHDPTGSDEPQHVSCLRLLQHWNEHEGRQQTFHLLFVRLRELGHEHLADRLSRSVADEKTLDVREAFLDDPFKQSPASPPPPPSVTPEPAAGSLAASPGASTAWIFVFVPLASLIISVGLVLAVRCILPDSHARMRTSLYKSFLGKRPGKEDLFYIM